MVTQKEMERRTNRGSEDRARAEAALKEVRGPQAMRSSDVNTAGYVWRMVWISIPVRVGRAFWIRQAWRFTAARAGARRTALSGETLRRIGGSGGGAGPMCADEAANAGELLGIQGKREHRRVAAKASTEQPNCHLAFNRKNAPVPAGDGT